MRAIAVAGVSPVTGDAICKGVGEISRNGWNAKSRKAAEQAMRAIAVAGVSPVTGDAPFRGWAKHRAASGDWECFISVLCVLCETVASSGFMLLI